MPLSLLIFSNLPCYTNVTKVPLYSKYSQTSPTIHYCEKEGAIILSVFSNLHCIQNVSNVKHTMFKNLMGEISFIYLICLFEWMGGDTDGVISCLILSQVLQHTVTEIRTNINRNNFSSKTAFSKAQLSLRWHISHMFDFIYQIPLPIHNSYRSTVL